MPYVLDKSFFRRLMTSLRELLETRSTRTPTIRQRTRSLPATWKRSILGLEPLEDRLTPDSGGAYLSLASGVVSLNPDGDPTEGLPQIMPNIKVEPIFVEDPTDAVPGSNLPTPMMSQLIPFLNTLVTTGLQQDLLTQYNLPGLTFGNGSVGTADIVSQAPDTSSAGVPCYSDALIQQIIQNEMTAGRTATADGLDVYSVVFTPAGEGVEIDSAPGDSSVVAAGAGFFAYHSSFLGSNGKVAYYAPIPDESLNGPNANLPDLGMSAFQSETQTITHELTEGSADAFLPGNSAIGWYSGNATVQEDGGGEVCDQAGNDGYYYDGYLLQNVWSNAITGNGEVLGTGADNLLVDQLTPPAVSGVDEPVQVATFTSGDTSLTASDFHAQVYDSVTDPDELQSLNWTNITITGSNGHFAVTATPLAGSVIAGGGDGPNGEYGTPFNLDGFTVIVSTSPFNLVNPSGNAPYAILQHPYKIAATAPFNYDANSGSGVNNFSLSEVGANYELSDNGLLVFTQPISQTTGINIDADPNVPGDLSANVDDSLKITGSLGQPVTFDGGPASLPYASVGNLYSHILPFVSGVTDIKSFTIGDFNAGSTGLVAKDITTNHATGAVIVKGTPTGSGTATFTVTATDSNGQTVTRSYAIDVLQSPAPRITRQPSGATVDAGGNASFTAGVSGDSLQAQWEVSTNGGAFGDVPAGGVYGDSGTSDTLTVTGATAGLNGSVYKAVFTNGEGLTATTSPVSLTVDSPPSVITGPTAATVDAGKSVSFSTTATGNPIPAVVWQISTNGSTWKSLTPGGVYGNSVDKTTLTISKVPASLNGAMFRAYFSNRLYKATSNSVAKSTPATLTVDSLIGVSGTKANQKTTGSSLSPFRLVTLTNPGNAPEVLDVVITLSENGADGNLTTLGGGTYQTGVYTLDGVSLSQAEAALTSLVYTPTTTGTTTFTIAITDAAGTGTNDGTSVIDD